MEKVKRLLSSAALVSLLAVVCLAQGQTYEQATILDIQRQDVDSLVHKETDAGPPPGQARYAIKVQIGDMVYVGRYKHATDYIPSNWEAGKTVEGRVGPHKHRIYLKDVSGKEVALPIITREPAKKDAHGK